MWTSHFQSQRKSVEAYLVWLGVALATLLPVTAGSTCAYQIPKCPDDSVIVVYAPIQNSNKWLVDLPTVDEVIKIKDAKPYLENLGILFPSGGYALYFGKTNTLIVATTSRSQAFLISIFDS